MSPKRTPVPLKPDVKKTKRKKRAPKSPPPHGTAVKSTPRPNVVERLKEVVKKVEANQSQGTEKSAGIAPQLPDENASPEESKAALYRYLRYSAGLYFVTDLHGCTIEQLTKHPMYQILPKGTLFRWAAMDRWTERRKLNLEKWRQAIENKIGSELVNARRTGMKQLREIFDAAIEKLQKEVVAPKTYEGLVQAVVKLAELMDTWNDKIAKAVIPDMPAAVSATTPMERPKPKLSQMEAREAAKLILDMRRKEMRAREAREKGEADGKDKPDLTVIEGE